MTNPSPTLADGHPANESASGGSLSSKLNWLRAAVLGANDGILSTAGLVMGVAGASATRGQLLVAGLAGVVAGALSMAGGEFVSVSSQKDTEQAELAMEADELRLYPESEFAELVDIYRAKGLSEGTAREVARELTEHDALRAHAEAELGIDPDDFTNPWHAAIASMAAFTVGAIIPLLAMVLSPSSSRVIATIVATMIGLLLTGFGSAATGGGPKWRPMVRNVVVGALGMGVTYAVGLVVGQHV